MAEQRNQSETVSFRLLNDRTPHLEINADAVLFESILSFLSNPKDVLRYYAQRIRGEGRMAVIELTLSDREYNGSPMPPLARIFGEEAKFRGDMAWQRIFNESGLAQLEAAHKPVGLMGKFWDDIREAPLGTMVDLGRTLYDICTDSDAAESARLFKSFFKDFSHRASSSYYILRPNIDGRSAAEAK